MAALLAWPLALPAFAQMHAGADEPTSTRAAAFDATWQRVIGPASLDSSADAYDADLERLRALLPAGDHARDQRADFRPGVGSFVGGHREVLISEAVQPAFLCQGGDRDQPGARHQIGVIKAG